MNILALDLATTTGWATESAFGTWDLSVRRDESKGMKLLRLKAKLREVIETERIELVVFESVATVFAASTIANSELVGVLKLLCEEVGTNYRSYTPGEIKKFATGKGNSNKEIMIQAAKEKLNYTGDDDNEVDALWLYQLAKRDLNL